MLFNYLFVPASTRSTAWKSVKAALVLWPSLWIRGSQIAARAEADSRVARAEQIYGYNKSKEPKPTDLEEVERKAGGKKLYPDLSQRPLPATPDYAAYAGYDATGILTMFYCLLNLFVFI